MNVFLETINKLLINYLQTFDWKLIEWMKTLTSLSLGNDFSYVYWDIKIIFDFVFWFDFS